jgi:L-rhamnose-H+ transport protein
MLVGILWALLAGLMLGLYAIPGKYTKDFKEENTWGLFFMLTMFVVPIAATLVIMKGVGDIYATPEVRAILPQMVVTSVLWGIGVMMWGKAIHHIGVSLGFSLFIGTVILVGSLLPFIVDGLPAMQVFVTIMVGLLFVLAGIFANGTAGIARERDEAAAKDAAEAKVDGEPGKKSMAAGIAIAVIGGLLATGFSFANAVGRPPLHEASMAQGNPEWVTALAVMFPIFLSGGVIMAGYFAWQLSQKKSWGSFKTASFGKNFILIFIMAFFHYAASAVFAYAAFKLGAVGNTVGYAIFNTACVVTAIVSGMVTGEWKLASAKAKNLLYTGLACMVVGILIISVGNKFASDIPSQEPVAATSPAKLPSN